MDIDEQELLSIFATESAENLDAIERGLVALESSPDDAETLTTVFRNVHTIKGNSASLGVPHVADLAHVVEELLARMRDRRLPVNEAIVTVLLRSADALRQLIAAGATEEAAPMTRRLAVLTPPRATTLRVDVDKLDRMLDRVGEIRVARQEVDNLLAVIDSPQGRAARELHSDAERLHAELEELVLRARMVPIEPQLAHLTRVARDVAAAHKKQVELAIDGGGVEVDTRVVEVLRDPLVHMIRNAVGHGIETPDEREAAGKTRHGRLLLDASHDAHGILITLSDDGRGIDRAEVVARARALGLVQSDDAALDDEKVADLVFAPGLSTSRAVSDLSGRGLGMDVVRRSVESLRGRVSIKSRAGKGTTIEIRLPLTVAIIEAFSARIGDELVALPMEWVSACADASEAAAHARDARGLTEHEGATIPWLRLRALFEVAGTPPARESLIVVEHDGGRAGIVVDELLGAGQVVVKSLGRLFANVRGVAGSALTGTGRVALILDVPEILKRAGKELR
jgi:two-component system chemotaxis sensor kinase CheA